MRLFVPLTEDEFKALRDIARKERRRVQDQAAVIIAQALAQEPASFTAFSEDDIDAMFGEETNESACVDTPSTGV